MVISGGCRGNHGCESCKSAIENVGCGQLSAKRLSKEDMEIVKTLINNMEVELTAKLTRPKIANAISEKLREHNERGF